MNRYSQRGKRNYNRWLSLVLILVLAAQSFWGNGITAKAADETMDVSKICATVVDSKGNGMSGVEAQLIDASASNEVIDTMTSETDGKIEYSVANLQNGEYRLKIPFNGTHTCKPANGYVYTVADGKVMDVDSKEYTGEEQFVMTSIYEEEETPQPDKETLIINVTDSEGRPFSEQIFVFLDSEFASQEGTKKAPKNGVLKVTVDSNLKSGEVRIAKAYAEQYEIEKFEFTAENKTFKTVNGETYDGTKTFTMKVARKGAADENESQIYSLSLDKNSLTYKGGTVTLEILGKNLVSNVKVDVSCGTEKLSVENTLDTENYQKFAINVPENTGKDPKEYLVVCTLNGNAQTARYVEFSVEGKTQEEEEKPDVPEGDVNSNAVIESAEVTPERISAEGGEVNLKITGTDLADNNWDIQSEVYYAGTTMSASGKIGKAEVKNKTKDGAILVIPTNSMRNDMEYHISIGATKNGGINVQKTIVVYQDGKEASVQINPKQVELTGSDTIVATMEADIVLGVDDVEKVKSKIYIAEHGTGVNKAKLTANDTVAVDGNQITIVFDKMPDLRTNSALFVEEGAFRRASDNMNLKSFSWMIYSKPTITGIELEDAILEYEGGIVEGTVKGVRLDEAPEITASIFKAGSGEVTDIPVTVGTGDNPSITFEVPQNDTSRTESYIINLTMGNTPVYVEEVVSVLAKGESETAQTLSAMTISGNNKTYTNENSTEITVKVSPQVGELKTRLNLYGTNLDSSKTEVRAIDQNGVYWKVTHIPE